MEKKRWQDLTREDFVRLITEMPATEIAPLYGVTPGAVYYKLRLFSLKSLHKPGPRKRFVPDKDELERLYRSMSMAKIAAHYGVGETVVFNRLVQYGIGGISRSDRLTGVKKSEKHRASMSQCRIGVAVGDKNPNWKGGVSSEAHKARSKVAYANWRAEVLRRAGWKCEKCGTQHGTVCKCCGQRTSIHAHHKSKFSHDVERRYDPANGMALCNRCHWLEHHQEPGELLGTP